MKFNLKLHYGHYCACSFQEPLFINPLRVPSLLGRSVILLVFFCVFSIFILILYLDKLQAFNQNKNFFRLRNDSDLKNVQR
jgi:hypothetical protein